MTDARVERETLAHAIINNRSVVGVDFKLVRRHPRDFEAFGQIVGAPMS